MSKKLSLLSHIPVLLVVVTISSQVTQSQRSLYHWKRDLELRLDSYLNQKNVINDIISTSIYPGRDPIQGPITVRSANVRFSDLIIPNGNLILESHIARSTMRIMVNKTQSYVNSKLNDLYQIKSHLEVIKRQLNDPTKEYIYKGSAHSYQPHMNRTRIQGLRLFKHLVYGNVLQADTVQLASVNFTNVNQVLSETYLENPLYTPYDANNRLFFEGRKTFWQTVFTQDLRSGCCDRLKPLHTNRMMFRSVNQDILAPVMIQTNQQQVDKPAVIHNLNVSQLHNRQFSLDMNRPEGFVQSQAENFIHINNLINIRFAMNQPEILKKLIFRDVVHIDEGQLSNSPSDHRLTIGILPKTQFDLSHENYLLKSHTSRLNGSEIYQQVSGTIVVNNEAHFLNHLEAISVNRIPNFRKFVTENLVRIDRPHIINSTVHFAAFPAISDIVDPRYQPPHSALVMQVGRALNVRTLNGMSIPRDVVFLHPHPAAKPPNEPIRVGGAMKFTSSIMENFVNVQNLINGIQMPSGVIPLHLNDPNQLVGGSNLLFADGITVHQVTVQSGQFDELQLRDDIYDDAQNLIVRSVFAVQPDGSQVIRAPLRINHLKIFGDNPQRGLLNGFRPTDVTEISRQPEGDGYASIIHGRKTFLAPVEAVDCIFNGINNLSNWTNHLIRIDRPNTVQTIHTRLAFMQPVSNLNNISNAALVSPQVLYNLTSSLRVNSLQVEFAQPRSQTDNARNWNYSPELYILHKALMGAVTNQTSGRYRILNQVSLVRPDGRVNGIALNDIVTLDEPFKFEDLYTLVGKVELKGDLRADRVTSNYPIDSMDLVQFHKHRVPILGSRGPIQLNNLVLAGENRASFVQSRLLNGISISDFFNSIMSLTRPQTIDTNLVFNAPVDLEGFVRTGASLNGIKNFSEFANKLKTATYSFEEGLQCNSVIIKI